MILPEALHPAMSRGGFAYEHGVSLGSSRPGDFPQTVNGLWLSQIEVSTNSLAAARGSFGKAVLALGKDAHPATLRARTALDKAQFNDATGCWHSDTPEHTEVLWTVATRDWGVVLNPEDQKDQLRLCDSPDCIAPRHFDFTFRRDSRQWLYEPTPAFYRTLPGGRIRTVWGDLLPDPLRSIADFRKLQAKCPPFAPQAKSPLTANGISQVTWAENGCWPVRSYYTKPPGSVRVGTDHYARLTLRRHLGQNGENTCAQMLAHRVLWIVSGRRLDQSKELNHLCGYRACAYPGHLREVTKADNNLHAARMQRAIRRLALSAPAVV